MALAIDATVSGPAANCYVTLAAANTYFDGRLGAQAWTQASDPIKSVALVQATNRLDPELWVGVQTTSTQRLAWPRYGVIRDDGWYFLPTEIPRLLIEATCELALSYLEGGSDQNAFADTGLEGFERVQLGSLSVDPRVSRRAAALPAQVVRLLRLLRLGGDGTVRVIRS